MSDQSGLPQVFEAMRDQLALLAVSGVAGAFFRAVFAPEKELTRRIVQGIGGALSALFLGGVLAHIIDSVTGAGLPAYLAAGFIMGAGGEVAVKALQDRMVGKK